MSKELYQLVKKRDVQGIEAFLTPLAVDERVRVWTDEWPVFCTTCPGCDAREDVHPAGALLYGPEGSVPQDIKEPEVLKFVIEKALITPECFSDEVLISKVASHCGWDYNHKMIKLLLGFVPHSRWLSMRDVYGNTILSYICNGHVADEKFDELWEWFTAIPGMLELATVKGQYGSILPCLISDLHFSQVRQLIALGMDVNEQRPTEMWKLKGETKIFLSDNSGLHSALRWYASSKDPVIWQKIHDMTALLMQNGLDLSTENIAGDDINDFIETYNWRPVLADLLKPYTGFEEKYESWHRNPYSEHHAKVHNLLRKLEKYKYSHDPVDVNTGIQMIVDVFTTIPRDLLKTFHSNLHNATRCMYGFLYRPEVQAFFDALDDQSGQDA